jgi:hypothetical protein
MEHRVTLGPEPLTSYSEEFAFRGMVELTGLAATTSLLSSAGRREAVRHAADDVTGSVSGAGALALHQKREPVTGPVREPLGERVTEPASEPVNEPLTERQERILHVLGNGDSLRVPAIASRMRASPATVKPELALLKGRGMVAFEGPPRSGRYRLTAGTRR